MTKANIMCLNIEKGEAFTQEVTLPRTYKDDKAILKAAEKVVNSNTVKAVHVVSAEVQETLSDRPDYANLDSPAKFQAIQGIIITRLKQYPSAICSYSGGSDSDIMIDLIERTRKMFNDACGREVLKPVKYVFFNTGLEMQAIKDHVEVTAEKYGVEIEEIRPKIGIVRAVKMCGLPLLSKDTSEKLSRWQKKQLPLSIVREYDNADDKKQKYQELKERYPKCVQVINWLCGCDKSGEEGTSVLFTARKYKYFLEFLEENPPLFNVSSKCCDYCKKQPAHEAQKGYEMVITGERKAEGGVRASGQTGGCFKELQNGQYRFRPLYYVSDKDKAWYKEHYGIKYSDAYEVYGLTRTGCCGCPISYKAVDDLEKIRPYEPNVVKAAWSIFGDSYRYRQKYNEYKAKRREEEKAK